MTTDILILFDTTGSMSRCIHEVRRRVHESLNKLFAEIPDLRIGMMAFGDYCDAPTAVQSIDFTDNKEKLSKFVLNSNDTSGGDEDEFYEKIFQLSKFADWKADRKIIIFIADALPHGSVYTHNGITYKIRWEDEVSELASMGINIYAVQAMGRTKNDFFYKQIADRTNGKRVELGQFSDVVETITAISYHQVGKLEEYKEELASEFKLNRSLVKLFQDLGLETAKDKSVEMYVKTDRSGLIPVPPYRFQILHVDENCSIKDFVKKNGLLFKIGRGFYQFMKTETVQEYKEVVLRNKLTGDMFTGDGAREFIGLPYGRRGNISPKLFEEYDVFIQSTSANRKLIGGYKFLYEPM